MSVFDGDKLIFGKYATIIKKYSRTSDQSAVQWKLSNGENSNKQVLNLFSSYIDCLYTAAALGLSKQIKIKEAPDKSDKANILASAWKPRQMDFLYLYRLMILTDKDLPLTDEERAKKICDDIPEDQEEKEFNYFLQFAYGGLIELDKELSEIQDYVGLSNYVCSLAADIIDEDDED